MPPQQGSSGGDDKSAAERVSDWLELFDKLSKSGLTAVLVLQGLGLLDDRVKSLTAEQILPYIVIIFVGLPLLGGLVRQAFPQLTSQAWMWRKLTTKLYRRPWLRQALFWLSLIAIAIACGYIVNRDFINQPPQIADVLLSMPQIDVSEKVELQVLLTDPNGPADIADITWTVDGHPDSIKPNAARPDIAEFTAPPQPGPYNAAVSILLAMTLVAACGSSPATQSAFSLTPASTDSSGWLTPDPKASPFAPLFPTSAGLDGIAKSEPIKILGDKPTAGPGEKVVLTVVDETGQPYCESGLEYGWSWDHGELLLPDDTPYSFAKSGGACQVTFVADNPQVVVGTSLSNANIQSTPPYKAILSLIVHPPLFLPNIGSEKRAYVEIQLVYPGSFYYHFILDASARMKQTSDTGQTLLDAARQIITERIESAPGNVYLGLRTFGPEGQPGTSPACENTDLVLNFELRDSGRYRSALQDVTAEGVPPLVSAIYNGAHDLDQLPFSRQFEVPNPPPGLQPYYLIAVTAGPDECNDPQSIGSLIEEFKKIYGDKYALEVILIHFAASRDQSGDDAERIKDLVEQFRLAGVPVTPMPVSSSSAFSDLLRSLFELSSPDILQAYQAALDLDLNTKLVLQARAVYTGELGQYDQSLADLDLLLAKFPEVADSADYWYLRGLTLANLGKWQESQEAFAKSIAIKGDFPAAHYGQAVAWMNMGEFNKSEAGFAAAFNMDKDLLKFYGAESGDIYSAEAFFKPEANVINPVFLANPNFYYIVTLPEK